MSRRTKWLLLILCLAALAVVSWRHNADAKEQHDEAVSAAIVLAIDYSGSIDEYELEWQLGGLAVVFADPEIERRIAESSHEAIAITAFRFGKDPQAPFIPWVILRPGDGSIPQFSLLLQEELARAREDRDALGVDRNQTNVGRAIALGHQLLLQWPGANRHVLDIQTDETGDDDRVVAIDAAKRAGVDGVLINVLLIGQTTSMVDNVSDMMTWYYRNVASGMVWDARDQSSYMAAIEAKLFSEIW